MLVKWNCNASGPQSKSARKPSESTGTAFAAVSVKTPAGKAINYMLERWDGLCLFIKDGRLEMDSNIVENAIRPSVLTRKNSMFAGHEQGAIDWGMFSSFLITAKMNGLNPEKWLEETLTKLVNDHPKDKLHMLLPFNKDYLAYLDEVYQQG